jgi:hypothetical protein
MYIYPLGNHKHLYTNKYTYILYNVHPPPFPNPVAALHAVKHGSRKGLARANFTCLSGVKLLNRMCTNWEVLVHSTYILGCNDFWTFLSLRKWRIETRNPNHNWIIRHLYDRYFPFIVPFSVYCSIL